MVSFHRFQAVPLPLQSVNINKLARVFKDVEIFWQTADSASLHNGHSEHMTLFFFIASHHPVLLYISFVVSQENVQRALLAIQHCCFLFLQQHYLR
jgi:hypothetical protein